MQQSKQFWRGLFFILLITALCGGMALPAVDLSVRAAPQMQVATDLVISEFRLHGSGGSGDEFIEIFNPTSSPINLNGWYIRGANNAGNSGTRFTFSTDFFLQPGQHYLLAQTGYDDSVIPDDIYLSGIPDDGGIALFRPDNSLADQVGLSTGALYQEGTVLAPLTSNIDQSYERQLDISGSCTDANNNSTDFYLRNPSDPQNSSSPITTCGDPTATPSPTFTDTLTVTSTLTTTGTVTNTSTVTSTATSGKAPTVTTIVSHLPNPSNVNATVTITVRVTSTSGGIPTGTVLFQGQNAFGCSITLTSNGTGSCTTRFTSAGTKQITARYNGDSVHAVSTDVKTHQVVSTPTPTRTPSRTPSPKPPPPLIAINEFVPRPGHDWNGDGVVNVGDEFIELLNHGVIDVNLSGYALDDEVNIGSSPYRLPSVTLKPGERRVFYGSETGLLLSDGGDGVRLIMPNGQLGDAYNYRVVRFPDQSYCRLPDNGGLDDWNQNCFPTPGQQNSLAGTVNSPSTGESENLCPISDTLPNDFTLAECPPFGNNIWNPDYWDRDGWYDEKFLPESPPGKWNIFVD